MTNRSRTSEGPLRVASVVSALSHALDLSTGQPPGHSIRSCLIGMHIAEEIGLAPGTRNDLFYAQLLKDCGCSGNASKTFHTFGTDDLKVKRNVKTTDWTKITPESVQYALNHVAPGKPFLERTQALFMMAIHQKVRARDVAKIRCERGSTLARLMGLSDATAIGVLHLDEHWDGQGNPEGLRRTQISLLARIMLLAQTLEVFLASKGPEAALDVVNKRSGAWFDPDLVKAVNSASKRGRIWRQAQADNFTELCLGFESNPRTMTTSDASLDRICLAFANIVDAKSPYTLNHSFGVANAAVAMSRAMGLSRERVMFVRHAALLHDLGKLGISNAILEKPSKLDNQEWEAVKQHPFHTWNILRIIPGFDEMSLVAGAHHEKLDGSGYFQGLSGASLPIEARIVAAADIFDALSAKRPYRDSQPVERVLEIMTRDAPHAIDPVCLEALRVSGVQSDQTFVDLHSLAEKLSSPPASYTGPSECHSSNFKTSGLPVKTALPLTI